MPVIYRDFDQSALDVQYNARAAVPDCPAFFDRWAAESAQVRAEVAAHLDLAYGDHPLERMDVFPAVGSAAPAPVLVFIHGGYWYAFDKSYASYAAPHWTRRGVAYVALNYALCPQVTLDEIVRQVRAAIAWLAANGADYGVDPARIFVSGHSAGGHLTAMALSDPARPPGVIGGLSISGLFDLEPIRLSFLNQFLHLDAAMAQRCSPLNVLPAAAPEQLFTVGGDETAEFHRQQSDYAAAWAARGLAGTVIGSPGTHHFSVVDQLAQPDSAPFRAVLRRLRPDAT